MRLIYKGTIHYFEITVLDTDGDNVSGLTVTYIIKDNSDDSTVTSGTMSEVSSTGIYKTSYTFTSTGSYRIEYTTPSTYENGVEGILVEDRDNFKADVSSIPSKDEIADQVWNEALADHQSVGTTGKALEDADATADPDAVADAVWDELISGHSTSGSFGELIKIIVGLCQSNYKITDQNYTTIQGTNYLQSAIIKLYPTATDLQNGTNLLASFQVNASYASNGNLTNYTVKKL